jgi:hypothetical protein
VDNDGKPDAIWIDDVLDMNVTNGQFKTDSDADFLKRVVKEARGGAPTALEEKYFAEDKDPKKREKLLDALLKDPAVAKKLGDDWKKKMLTGPSDAVREFRYNYSLVDPKKDGTKYRVTPIDPKTGQLMPDLGSSGTTLKVPPSFFPSSL